MDRELQEANGRSSLIASLRSDFRARVAYIKAKVGTLVPSQIRGLRLKSDTPTQPGLARAAEMHQSRISTLETAGSNPTIATLSEIAAALNVGLKIEFVPFSEMLDWENGFSQDAFNPTRLEQDTRFLRPAPIVNPAPTFSMSNLLKVNLVEIASLRDSFSGQIEATFDQFVQLSAGGNILIRSPQSSVPMSEPLMDAVIAGGSPYGAMPAFMASKELSYLTGGENVR